MVRGERQNKKRNNLHIIRNDGVGGVFTLIGLHCEAPLEAVRGTHGDLLMYWRREVLLAGAASRCDMAAA